jgi:hypothetical protein
VASWFGGRDTHWDEGDVDEDVGWAGSVNVPLMKRTD